MAYFYSDLDKKIYIKQPEGSRLSGKEKKVWQLHKVLYGFKQASLSWWQTITKLMLVLGFKQCKSNTNVYYFIDKETRELVIAIIYINDICFMNLKDFLLLLELKWKFMTKWEYYDLRETKKFFRMYINYSYKDQKIFIV